MRGLGGSSFSQQTHDKTVLSVQAWEWLQLFLPQSQSFTALSLICTENQLLSYSLRLWLVLQLCVLLCSWYLHTLQPKPCRANCFSHIQHVYGPLRLTGLQHSSHKKNTCKHSFESCSQTCWHYKLWFNLTSPWHKINIIWLI